MSALAGAWIWASSAFHPSTKNPYVPKTWKEEKGTNPRILEVWLMRSRYGWNLTLSFGSSFFRWFTRHVFILDDSVFSPVGWTWRTFHYDPTSVANAKTLKEISSDVQQARRSQSAIERLLSGGKSSEKQTTWDGLIEDPTPAQANIT
eukprot:3439057-Pyramimonas_sp.AAC.1